jgi:hypothetical protein
MKASEHRIVSSQLGIQRLALSSRFHLRVIG